jgi:ribosomal protein S18 acetylase RimI-like enzyme
MAHSESLLDFSDPHEQEIVRWAPCIGEVRRWAGSAVCWPVDVSVFRHWHADPDVKPYVLCEGDVPIGYGEVWIDEVELGRIIVKPVDRGRGVGRRLVRLLLEQASLSGLPGAFVRVVPENRAAIACYRAAGALKIPEGEKTALAARIGQRMERP